MSDAVMSAIITGGLALLGVIITCAMSNRNIERKLEVAQAVTDTKIEELTREVREHNNFAKRMPIVENEIIHLVDEMNYIENEIQKHHG